MNHGWDWAFSNIGLEVGLPDFQLPCSQNVTHCRKEICSTCLSKESMPFVKSKPPLHIPEAWGPWERQHAPPAHYGCIMPIPSLQLQKRLVSCTEAKRLVTQLWSWRFVTILWYLWLCSQLCYETAANQRTLVEIELLATVGWKRGCQPFSCPCSQNVTHCRKEICSTCLSKESMPFVKSKPPFPTRSLRSLRAAARSTSSLWLQHACKR